MRQYKMVLYLCLIPGLAICGCAMSESASGTDGAPAPAASTIHVYYFHLTVRCPSCERIEAWTRKAVEEGFPGELASSTMHWSVLNTDEPQNKHFQDDYHLQAQSVVLSEMRGGKETRWKNLEKVWDLLDSEEKFAKYIQDEVHAFASAAADQKTIPENKPAEPTKEKKVEEPTKKSLPKLIDLGADKCIPCKKMAPILDALKKEYEGKFEVVFIDVWKKGEEAKKYNINLIPTQIFFDAAGKEIFRHEGFFPKEDILAKWKEFGVDVTPPTKPETK